MDQNPQVTCHMIIAVANLLAEHDISLTYCRHRGITAEDAVACVDDRDAFDARLEGVPVEIWKAWKAWDFTCQGKTAKGQPCKREVMAGDGGLDDVRKFSPLDPAYRFCKLHICQVE